MIRLKQGDTAPPLVMVLMDGDTPIDLTTAQTIKLRGVGVADITDATLEGDANGQVIREWGSNDTAVAGRILMEVEVTWGDGTKQTFPSDGYIEVYVMEDVTNVRPA